MTKETYIIKRLPTDKTMNAKWSDALKAIQQFDHNGNKQQDIGEWEIKKNRTNITAIYIG